MDTPAARPPRRRWPRVLFGLAALPVVVALGAMAWGSYQIARPYRVTPVALALPADSAALAHGAHLALINGCHDCHGDRLQGQVMMDETPARVVAPNLTPAGVGAAYEPEDWDRAIRHGVRRDGTAMFLMPSSAYHGMSDTEAARLIAYLESLAPVASSLPETQWRPLGRLLAAGPMDYGSEVRTGPTPATSPPPGATAAYGAYATRACAHCHGAGLRGGPGLAPGSPPAPDLRAAGAWPPEAFHTALTTGVRPAGPPMNPQFMPWTATRHMTRDEREGVRLYLQALGRAAG